MAAADPHRPPLRTPHRPPPDLARNRARPPLAVSVLIAANGPLQRLEWQLASLAAQRYPEHLLEVVVAFGGEVPSRPPELRPAHCRFVPYDRDLPPRSAGYNAAAKAADGQLYLILDAASVPWPDLVRRHVDRHGRENTAVLGRRDLPASWPPHGAQADICAALASGHASDIGAAEPEPVRGPGLPHTRGVPLSLRRRAFQEVGGFAESMAFAGEFDLLYRLRAAGAGIVAEPEARSWYIGPGLDEEEHRRLRPFLAQRLPGLFADDRASGVVHRTPDLDIAIETGGADPIAVERRILPLLADGGADVRITLLAGDRAADRSLRRHFEGEPRVRVAEAASADPAVPRRLRIADGESVEPALAPQPPNSSVDALIEQIREVTSP